MASSSWGWGSASNGNGRPSGWGGASSSNSTPSGWGNGTYQQPQYQQQQYQQPQYQQQQYQQPADDDASLMSLVPPQENNQIYMVDRGKEYFYGSPYNLFNVDPRTQTPFERRVWAMVRKMAREHGNNANIAAWVDVDKDSGVCIFLVLTTFSTHEATLQCGSSSSSHPEVNLNLGIRLPRVVEDAVLDPLPAGGLFVIAPSSVLDMDAARRVVAGEHGCFMDFINDGVVGLDRDPYTNRIKKIVVQNQSEWLHVIFEGSGMTIVRDEF